MADEVEGNERAGPRLHLGGVGRVWLLTSGMAALTALLLFGVIARLEQPAGAVDVPWWLFVLFFYLAEAYVVHFHFRKEAHTFSATELGIVLGFFCVAPPLLVIAHQAGAALALAVHRRQRPIKLAFNLAQFGLSTSVAVVAFHLLLGGAGAGEPRAWLAALVAVSISGFVGVVAVSVVISVAEGESHFHELPQVALVGVVGSLANAGVALIAVELLRTSPLAVLLLLIPVTAIVLAFRAYTSQRARHEHLEFLYDSMRTTQGARDFDDAVREVLLSARRMLRAEYAELVLLPGSAADQVVRSTVTARGESLMQATELTQVERLAVGVIAAHDGAVLLPKEREPTELDGMLDARSLADGMITALRGDTRTVGVLLVGDRSGDVSTFGPDDRRLLETFASHASVLLENDRLEETLSKLRELQDQLRHQAFHDALTGLPNRVQLAEQVAEALALAAEQHPLALVFLDLDDFKMINDTLGHGVGDELLVQVAERIRDCIRPGDIPARLGGDEFAVLMRDVEPADVERIASRLVEAMRAPFELAGRELFVRGSVGIAVAESTEETADELLRNADVAMYNAKEGGKGRYAMYEPEMHLRVARRHELSAALDRALDRGEISIRFQPIVRLADERAIAVEALLRWRHPRYGFVSPVDFVPIAEETGLMIPFTRFVLTAALESSREWADLVPEPERADFCVAVNLSPTDLLNPYLVREVAAALEHTGWDAHRLVLEITETGAMRDPATTLRALHGLRGLGVRLALDDFGTGHSSLDHLGDFPVDVLKIAKPFVDRIGGDAAGIAFVESILRLVSVLGLRSVAEGIEREAQFVALQEIGCELGQGYHFARPLELDGLLQYFAGGSVPAPPEAEERDAAGTLAPLTVPRSGRRAGGPGA